MINITLLKSLDSRRMFHLIKIVVIYKKLVEFVIPKKELHILILC